jgi:hypothetical protein
MKARGWAVARETSSFGRQSSVACSNNSGRAGKLPGRSLGYERSQNSRRLARPLTACERRPSFGMGPAQLLGGMGTVWAAGWTRLAPVVSRQSSSMPMTINCTQ